MNAAFFALLCLASFLLFGVAAVGTFMTANYPVSAACAAFSIAAIVWGCAEARACRRG